MTMVIDASASLSWFFADERTAQGEELLRRVVEEGAVVPGMWRLEMANALQLAVRRGRVNAAFRDDSIRRLGKLPIAIDPEMNTHAWTGTLLLAAKHELTVYDAAYLELAIRLNAALATRDIELLRAAESSQVETIEA